MRIAISGSHRTGKTTLVEELGSRLPAHTTVVEPYLLLVEEGYPFAHPPSIEDVDAQLERSIELLETPESDVIFDRCPLDLAAYISIHEGTLAVSPDDHLPRALQALESLDLLVFVPIESEDRIVLSPSDAADESREAVDHQLREWLHGEVEAAGTVWLEVTGSPKIRAEMVLRSVDRHQAGQIARTS